MVYLFPAILAVSPAPAQEPGQPPSNPPPAPVEAAPIDTLAAFVPADAGFFLEIRKPDALGQGEQAAALLAWIGQFTESNPRAKSGGDYRIVISNWLGLPDGMLRSFDIQSLALVAEDRLRTHEAAVIFRGRENADKGSATKTLKIVKTQRRGRAVVSQTESGVWIARRGDLFVVSASGRARGQFESLMRMLNQHDRPALAESQAFQHGALQLGGGAPIWAHVIPRPSWSSAALWMLAGLGLPEGPWFVTLDVKPESMRLRAVAESHRRNEVPSDVVVDNEVLLTLPQNTWLAWSASWSRDGLLSKAAEALSQFQSIDAGERIPIDPQALTAIIGSITSGLEGRATYLLGADLSAERPIPTLGMVIDAGDPAAVAVQIGRLFEAVIRRPQPVGIPAVDDGTKPGIDVNDRMGHQVWSLALQDVLPSTADASILGSILRQSRLSWAALDNAVVLTSQPWMVERVIAARSGLAPRLGSMEELSGSPVWKESGTLIGCAQPGLACHVLDNWMRQVRPDAAPLAREVETREFRLGIRGDAKSQAGSIKVVEVAADGPAAGFLQVGDRILGVDGALIPLDATSREVRQILDRKKDKQSITLRVERDNRMLDVEISTTDALPSESADFWPDLENWSGKLRQIGVAAFRVGPTSGGMELDATVRLLPRRQESL